MQFNINVDGYCAITRFLSKNIAFRTSIPLGLLIAANILKPHRFNEFPSKLDIQVKTISSILEGKNMAPIKMRSNVASEQRARSEYVLSANRFPAPVRQVR